MCASTPPGIQKTCRPHPGKTDDPHDRPERHIDKESGNNDEARKPPDQSPGADVACPICGGLCGYVHHDDDHIGARRIAAIEDFTSVLVSPAVLAAHGSCNLVRRHRVPQDRHDEDCRGPKDGNTHGLFHPAGISSD
jgi:hypothetical protein